MLAASVTPPAPTGGGTSLPVKGLDTKWVLLERGPPPPGRGGFARQPIEPAGRLVPSAEDFRQPLQQDREIAKRTQGGLKRATPLSARRVKIAKWLCGEFGPQHLGQTEATQARGGVGSMEAAKIAYRRTCWHRFCNSVTGDGQKRHHCFILINAGHRAG
jgi:hypothetical protein